MLLPGAAMADCRLPSKLRTCGHRSGAWMDGGSSSSRCIALPKRLLRQKRSSGDSLLNSCR